MVLLEQVFTKNFFQNVFVDYFKKDAEILNIVVEDLLKPGENYCSEMKRILITYNTEGQNGRTISIVAKCTPENEYNAKFVNEMKLFDCELEIYGTVLPKFHTLDHFEQIAPQVYSCCTKPVPIILLEDLSKIDFKLVARRDGLDLEHSLLVMEKLAHLHAASVTLYEKDCDTFKRFDRIIFQETEIKDKIMRTCYDEVVEICRRVPELHKYVSKLTTPTVKDRIFNKMYRVHQNNSKFKVLNHGDCWTNNIMFRYDEAGILVDLRFVDFQGSCFASPCLDLHYYLSCSLQSDINDQKGVIIDHYFDHLLKNLGKFHAKAFPNREEFDNDFKSTCYMGFAGALLTLTVCKVTKTDNASAQSFINDDGVNSFRYHCFHNEEYIKEVMDYLPFYDKLGIFDV
ncbi:hypothetical protein RI129_009540 [Pyrocoelia pectoralis]|uniref:CHK kinase-like domain-containing protein n=1 Tax=Pyrocoelia pectoralis TaxID=417401 RepID=A0AAN7V6A6_9COLE